MFNSTELKLMALGALYAGGLAGCATYYKAEDIERVDLVKIETPLATQFCSGLLGGLKRGCAIRLLNTETGKTNCVVVMHEGDSEAAYHEAGHCLGYDHKGIM